MLGKRNAIHELTRNDTKEKLWFELFRVTSWIAFLLLWTKERKETGKWMNKPPDAISSKSVI